MNIHYFHNEGPQELLDNYFLPSLRRHNPELRPQPHMLTATNEHPGYGSLAFRAAMREKAQKVLELLHAETEPFLVSDIDIDFLGSIKTDLIFAARGPADIVFQQERCVPNAQGHWLVNTGFMLMKPVAANIATWQGVVHILDAYNPAKFMNEQILVNNRFLPHMNYSTFAPTIWNWTLHMKLLPYISVNHANCAPTVEKKIAKLDEVRRLRNQT